jgi:DNA-binding transcriptional MerR regulator
MITVRFFRDHVDSVTINDYSNNMSAPWTLTELTAHVDAVLRAEAIRQENGQVAEAPNGRTVRWYQSIGLLSRPEQRGRTAYYGAVHLAELVAIKRLQSRGFSLADVQTRLQGLGDDDLFSIAALPPLAVVPPSVEPDAPAEHDVDGVGRRLNFWQAEACEPPPAAAAEHQPDAPPATIMSSSMTTSAPTLRHSHDHPAGVTLVLPIIIDVDVAQALLGRIVDDLTRAGLLPAPTDGHDIASGPTQEKR